MSTLLQINTSVNRGSTGRIAEQIAEKAIDRGWDCYTAYSNIANPSKTHLYRISNKFTVYRHGFYSRLFDTAGLGSIKATQKFISFIDEIKPDIVHLHNIHGYVLNYKILFEYLNKQNIPVVWTFHDFWAITGHCCHFISANCTKWQIECNHCPKTRGYPTSYFDFSRRNFLLKKELFTKSNLHVVAVSKWVEKLTHLSFLKNKDIRCIENGVDIESFKPLTYKGYSIPDDKYVIMGVASQWNASKGLQDYCCLSEKLSDDEIIVLVGLNVKQIKQLPKNIIGIKRTESVDELARLYSRADVITSLSYGETFGLTIIEGYACGTPAVVYDNTALPQLINEKLGHVVPTGNIRALYETLQEMKASSFKKHHSSDCIQYARNHFDKDKCFNMYVDLYEELVKEKFMI